MDSSGSRRATIRQVAGKAGVSIATVSRVFNGLSTVDPAMVDRVRDAAERLGYRPNATARALTLGRTSTVGLLVPDLANPYFNQLLKHFSAAAEAEGYRLLVADSDLNAANELPLCHELLRQVDGLALLSPRMPPDDVRTLLAEGLPTVWANRLIRGVTMPAVAVDSLHGMGALRGHLEALGHRRAVYLAGPRGSWSQTQRWRALKQPRPDGLTTTSVPAGNTIDEGFAAVDAALEGDPTVMVCFNDLTALGALARLWDLGVRVPEEMSLTGFDDIPFASFVSPPLTTTASPAVQVGRDLWDLFAALRAGTDDGAVRWFRPDPILRQSTAPPAR